MAYNEEYAKFYKLIDPSFFNMLDVESVFHKTFHPNACHVCNCFGEKVNLKRCGACDMISYCSKEHQLKDWSSHKEICKVIRQIKKELEVNNLYESLKVSNAFNGVEEMLSIFLGKFPTGLETTFGKSFKKISQMKGLKLIKDLSDRAMELLGRPLKYYELQMFSSPRVCAVCFECNPHLLTNCKKCPQSSFCEMHINDPSHENQCFKFISTLYSPCGIYETVPPLILDIIDEMKLPVQTEFEKLPNSMTKFFERYFSKVSFHLFSIEKRVAFNTYFSNKYSSSLTILFAMEKLSLNLNSMTIHVVGASTHEQIFNDWEAILHYLPQLNKLKIVLIGLEFIPPGSVKMQKQCKLCKKNKRQFIIETIMIEYHKYCDSENFEKPDMIACFNPGFYAYKSWEKSIEIFNKGQCPVLITSYNEMEGNQDKEIVDKKFPSANCIFNDYNPFASFYFKTLYVVCDFSADNEFIFIYKHLGNLKVSK